MAVYIIIFILIALSAIYVHDPGKKSVVLTGFAIILCLLAGLRGSIDGDAEVYYNSYNRIINGKDVFLEPSYYLISHLSNFLFGSYQGVVFIYALLSIIPFTYIIIKHWNSNIYILLVYYSFFFFLHPMTQIRLSAAIIYLIISIKYIEERKIWKFLLCIVAGAFFHQTILLFIPFYFILQKEISIKTEIALTCIAIGLSLTFSLSNIILSIAGNLSGNLMATKLMMHKATLDGGVGARTATAYYLMALIKIGFNLFLKSRFSQERHKLLFLYLNINFYGYLIYILFADMHLVAARISELLGITEVFFIPYLIRIVKPRYAGELIVIGLAFFQLTVTLYIVGFIHEYEFFFA